MIDRVVFSPEAQDQLVDLYVYIAGAASPAIAAKYTEQVVSYCESLRTFPERGTKRDDLRPGLRVTNYKKRVVIAFSIDLDTLSVLGVFYGGQDHESILRDDADSDH
jgi:plasmid stabilization system protein ParE